MNLITKNFGTIQYTDDKIITFPKGICGFPDLKKWIMLDNDENGDSSLKWLQSIDEPAFALPCIDPLLVVPDYSPKVLEENIKDINDIEVDNFAILVTITVPPRIEDMTANLVAPIIINTKSFKGAQVIIEGDEYDIRFKIYDLLKKD